MTKRFRELTFRDNFMFGQVMMDKEICRGVLEALLQEPIGKLTSPENEKTIQYTKDGRPIRLDILTQDDISKAYYDTEMQNLGKQKIEHLELGRRSRYYQAVIDSLSLEKKAFFKALPDSNVIFICTFDPFGEGKYRYTFENRCMEDTSIRLSDHTRKIFFNTTSMDPKMPEETRKLFEFIENNQVSNKLTEEIQERILSVREREDIDVGYWSVKCMLDDAKIEGIEEGIEKGIEKGLEKGREEGRTQGALLTMYGLVRDGLLTPEQGASRSGLTVEEFLTQGEVLYNP